MVSGCVQSGAFAWLERGAGASNSPWAGAGWEWSPPDRMQAGSPREPVVPAGLLFLPLGLAILFFPGTCNIRRNENYTASGLAIFSPGWVPKICRTEGPKR